MSNICFGDVVLSRDGSAKGTVVGLSVRYCAACGRVSPCANVRWEDGKLTKPCTRGTMKLVKRSEEGAVWQLT
jgi:hypothetical protein